jgi:phage-related protein
MAGPAILKIQVITDASRAVAGLRGFNTAADDMSKRSQTVGQRLGSMAKTAGKVAGAAALGGLVLMLKTGVSEQSDFLSGQAQLANGLKSTGNAANTSVTQLEDLASSIQNYSGQTDDSIVASEKLLLTFTNVGNKAGKNNDIFNQATKMTADMAAKMGGDASKYAVQLGKALNDPTKGITALTRVGVTFTAGQKKSIKTMQDSGDTLGAQKVIMKELQKEFGGSAKAAGQTLPGQMKRAQRSFEDISQSVAASLMPALQGLANVLTQDILPAFKAVMDFIMAHKTVFLVLATAIGVLVTAIKIATVVNELFGLSLLTNPVFWLVAGIVALVAVIAVVVQRTIGWGNVLKALGNAAKAVWNAVKIAFTAIKGVVQGVINWLLHSKIAAVLLGPWRIALGALNALIKGGLSGLVAYFRGLLGAIGRALSTVWSVITSPFRRAWNSIRTIAGYIGNALSNAATKLGTAVSTVWSVITSPFRTAWTTVKTYAGYVKAALTGIGARITRSMSNVKTIIFSPFKNAWTTVKTYAGYVKAAFTGITTRIRTSFSGLAKIIYSPFVSAWTTVKKYAGYVFNCFSGITGAIKNAMSKVADTITAPFSAAWDWIKKNVIDKISSGFSTVTSGIKTVKTTWNGIADFINGVKFSWDSKKVGPVTVLPGGSIDPFPTVPKFRLAAGAYVNRPTYAMVGEAGPEFVTPERMLRKLLAESGSTTIIVNGALDPDAVARQIRKIETSRARRVGGVRRSGTRTVGATA